MQVALIAIMRNEVRYLLEWVAYHRLIGFDEIFVYDNVSNDGTTLLCQELQAAGLINYKTWIDPAPEEKTGPQIPAYRDAAQTVKADWLCFLDADEFLVLDGFHSIHSFIQSAGRESMPIALNWKIFGSNNLKRYDSGLVTDRFTRRGLITADVNRHIKTIGPRSALIDGAQVHVHGWILNRLNQFYVNAAGHRIEVSGCTFVDPPMWNFAWVNHYIVKSLEEFQFKRRRGKVSHNPTDPEKFSQTEENYFRMYDANDLDDQFIRRLRPKLVDEIMNIRLRIGVLG